MARNAVAHSENARTTEDMETRFASCFGGGALLVPAFALLAGCSTIRASAIPVGPTLYAPGNGDVAVYASGIVPPSLVQVGEIRVSGAGSDARIDKLFPEFIRKAASIGGTAVSLDVIDAGFQTQQRTGWTSFRYGCGYGQVCVGQNAYAYIAQIPHMTLVGRALRAEASVTVGVAR